jgi:hypothetical protein
VDPHDDRKQTVGFLRKIKVQPLSLVTTLDVLQIPVDFRSVGNLRPSLLRLRERCQSE